MQIVALILGLFFLAAVGLDTFQTIILPRRPSGRLRITRLFFIATWTPWTALARRVKDKKLREEIYGIYGPLSLILLLALWATLLMIAFGLLFFAIGSPFQDSQLHDMFRATGQSASGAALSRFRGDLYVSGTTLFTLGLGDVLPQTSPARALIIAEAGFGLGFIALVIGYLPVLYGAFSKREVSIALLDARAGSPPTAGELLRRHGFDGGEEAVSLLLAEWERWAAELLESHVSYPLLCYYRSQHDNQSWLSALTAILDACSLLITSLQGTPVRQAQLTFAIARHALVDLVIVFNLKEKKIWQDQLKIDRLPSGDFRKLCGLLSSTDIELCGDPASEERLRSIRALYEPYAHALAEYLAMPLAKWVAEPKTTDQWSKVEGLRSRAATPLRAAAKSPLVGRAGETVLHDEHHH
jgi:hypothetical protein